MYQLTFYVPDTHRETVKEALFAAGAGKIGNYDCCCWECEGQGQFRALLDSTPFQGKINIVERVKEWKIEMVFSAELLEKIIETLHQAHPYETPAYAILELLNV